ncbi:uncharacterized protein LOC125487426 [Rhincodon typus]|uniref:uncharacterized protein LOC125487426 n=1 Tax=Rhincodon typus TaxID=259920 RepID=UPI002030BDB9|nr:uncharacterized protein LOC125487426 [Rhincodon typus]
MFVSLQSSCQSRCRVTDRELPHPDHCYLDEEEALPTHCYIYSTITRKLDSCKWWKSIRAHREPRGGKHLDQDKPAECEGQSHLCQVEYRSRCDYQYLIQKETQLQVDAAQGSVSMVSGTDRDSVTLPCIFMTRDSNTLSTVTWMRKETYQHIVTFTAQSQGNWTIVKGGNRYQLVRNPEDKPAECERQSHLPVSGGIQVKTRLPVSDPERDTAVAKRTESTTVYLLTIPLLIQLIIIFIIVIIFIIFRKKGGGSQQIEQTSPSKR